MAGAWVIRSGKYGERDEWATQVGVSGGGWREVPDLTQARDRAGVEGVIAEVFGAESAGLRASYTGQMWALRGRIEVGDLLVLPMKTTRELAMGRVTSGYRYLSDEADPNCRHVVEVEWKIRVPRTVIKQDLLYTLGSAISIFSPSRNNAVARLEHVFAHGTDPGALGVARGPARIKEETTSQDLVDEPELLPNVAELAHDQIITRIGEEFSGHGFAHLVTELLRAEGFDADEAPPGADGGIDITAGRGLLGLESPKLIVQVKTGQVGSEVVAQLNGLVVTQGADFGLLATWAGLSKPARDAVKHQRFRVKVWDSKDIVDGVLRNYERLPEAITSRLPLHRVWMLRDDT
ncbi:restriction system protein [Frondihabitans sp. PhB188]|uniref:restriction endonuclease n=1 Tax=Frondihabitans sp. PhB188 TaxID=2485200 RepID=UPI000F4938FE|nr:restriction endonuclease [Frondihabitans sp. PhB188]ROQ40691.1 restriction system protein [Frondihabitans sp. PhB188]